MNIGSRLLPQLMMGLHGFLLLTLGDNLFLVLLLLIKRVPFPGKVMCRSSRRVFEMVVGQRCKVTRNRVALVLLLDLLLAVLQVLDLLAFPSHLVLVSGLLCRRKVPKADRGRNRQHRRAVSRTWCMCQREGALKAVR